MSEVQAVIFKNTAYTPTEARKWLKKEGLIPMKAVHKVKNYLRYRITDPKKYSHFISKDIDNGNIHFIIGFLNTKGGAGPSEKFRIFSDDIKYFKDTIDKIWSIDDYLSDPDTIPTRRDKAELNTLLHIVEPYYNFFDLEDKTFILRMRAICNNL